jgi:Amt family ammonium transporter
MGGELASYDRALIFGVYTAINVIVFISGVLIFMMQAGFMLLETGAMSRKNAINNIFKNFIDLCVCGIFFYWFGYPIVQGDSIVVDWMRDLGFANRIESNSPGPVVSLNSDIALFFNFAFAATCVTICSGAVTGRIATYAYLVFGAVFSAFVYPIVAFTVWNADGLLHGVLHDFAGSVVVHALGGFAGLAGAIMLRPRIGEFGYGKGQVDAFRFAGSSVSNASHNIPLSALGVFMLWIGWYGFNAGSTFAAGFDLSGIDLSGAMVAPEQFADAVFNQLVDGFGTVIINTTLAPCAAVFAVMAFFIVKQEKLYISDMLNGALAGLVGITGNADAATAAQAMVIGVISGFVYILTVMALYKAKIDDPVGAFPVHGTTGVMAAGLFALTTGSMETGPTVFGTQIFYAAMIAAFGFFSALITFWISSRIMYVIKVLGKSKHFDYGLMPRNHLRVTPEQELAGMDKEIHGQDAYAIHINAPGKLQTARGN